MLSNYEAVRVDPWEKKRGRTACSSERLNSTNEDKSPTQRTSVEGENVILKERCLQGSEEEDTAVNWPGNLSLQASALPLTDERFHSRPTLCVISPPPIAVLFLRSAQVFHAGFAVLLSLWPAHLLVFPDSLSPRCTRRSLTSR